MTTGEAEHPDTSAEEEARHPKGGRAVSANQVSQSVAEGLERAPHLRFHRLDREAERRGDLAVAQVLMTVQREDQTAARRKLRDRILQLEGIEQLGLARRGRVRPIDALD